MACWLCLIHLSSSKAQPQIPSPLPGTYVNDLAGVLTKENIAALNEKINTIEKAYSVQIAIVLVRKLSDDMDIADFARGIGRKWHASINDSGLVYVASIDQRKQRLEVSTNLEGIIPDITARTITDQLKPFFRKKDYAGGLEEMLTEIDARLKHAQAEQNQAVQPPAQQTPENTAGPNVDNSGGGASSSGVIFAFIFGFLIFLIGIFSVRRRRSEYYSGSGVYIDSTPNNNNIAVSGSSGSNDYGNWGGDSSSSSDPGFSSSDSGFSGGGASNDW